MNKVPPLAEARSTPAARLDEGALTGVLGYQLAQVSVVTNVVFETQVAAVHQLRQLEYTALALVRHNEGLTATQLATALAVSAPHMTACIDRLMRRGFVDREPHASDRRALRIRTTAAGREVVDEATARICEAETQAVSRLSVAERLMLLELLHKAARGRVAT